MKTFEIVAEKCIDARYRLTFDVRAKDKMEAVRIAKDRIGSINPEAPPDNVGVEIMDTVPTSKIESATETEEDES